MNAADIIAAYEFTLRQIARVARGDDPDIADGDHETALQEIGTLAEDALAEREQ